MEYQQQSSTTIQVDISSLSNHAWYFLSCTTKKNAVLSFYSQYFYILIDYDEQLLMYMNRIGEGNTIEKIRRLIQLNMCVTWRRKTDEGIRVNLLLYQIHWLHRWTIQWQPSIWMLDWQQQLWILILVIFRFWMYFWFIWKSIE